MYRAANRPQMPAAERRRRNLRIAIAGAFVAALFGHWYFWYRPAERPTAPSAPMARLLDGAGSWDQVVWMAYPHQNLGAVDTALGSLDDYLGELAHVAGTASPRLPHFGPFAVPPAKELALAWNRRGGDEPDDLLGVARVYRGVGWVARLAGQLAGNRWLAGGRVENHGRIFRVRWDGPYWIVESGRESGFAVDSPGASTAERGDALAEFRITQPTGPLEPGNLVLARVAGDLEVRGGEIAGGDVDRATEGRSTGALRLDLPDLALWVATSDRGPIGGPGLFLMWEEKEGAIPRVAVLQRGGGSTFHLPGEKLLELVGKGDPKSRLGWTGRGTDRKARSEALRIVPWLESNYPRAGGDGAWLAAAGRLAPRRAARLLDGLAARLRAIPLLPARDIARVEAGARLLRPLADCSRLTFEVWRDPAGVRVRLCPQGAEEPLEPSELESSSEEDDEIDETGQIR